MNQETADAILEGFQEKVASNIPVLGAFRATNILEQILNSLVVEDEIGGNAHRNIHTMNCGEIRKYLQTNCTRAETDEEISLRMFEEWGSYPQGEVTSSFPDWLKER